jgi:hypothetical protein
MINVAQITAQLAKLPDAQLQQYAMMHKSDPYAMALAVSEANRRKRLRASTNAGPAQEPPKVADQAVAAMAPQPSGAAGIDALPSGDMNFADGGIVAFAGGGGAYETPYDRMNRQNRERQAAEQAARAATANVLPYSGVYTGDDGQYYAEPISAAEMGDTDPYAALKKFSTWAGRNIETDPTTGETVPKTSAPAALVSRPTERMTPQQMEAKVAPAAPKAKPSPKAKSAPEAGLGGTREAAALRDTAGTPRMSGPTVDGAKGIAGSFLDTKGLRGDLDKLYAEEQAAVDAARKRQSEGKPEGAAYSKYEELLNREEAGAAKEKDEAQGVAIFKAGLAMMAGSSRNAFENIGKGAMAGLEEYSGAMKDMKRAAKERQKALADIDNARRAEARDDWKAAQTFEEKADARLSKAREFGVKSIMDITGKDAEIASKIYATQVEQQGALQRTNIQAGATLQAARLGQENREQRLLLDSYKAQIAAIDKDLAPLLKMPTTGNKAKAAVLEAEKAQLMQALASTMGAGTMPGAPGAQGPSGTRPPLSSFQR